MDSGHEITIEEMLAHAGWLRSLALALTRDEASAEDLVQKTWLSALRSPPRNRPAIRSWLRRVLKRHSAETWRADESRTSREFAVAQPESLPGAAELASRAESQERLIRAVRSLREPYRTTVLLRYFDELPPRAVAHRLGVPVETVRARVRRAREMLREHLDETGGGRGAWLGVIVPLLKAHRPPAYVGAAAGLATLGGLVMNTKLLLTTAGLLLALALALVVANTPAAENAPAPESVAEVPRGTLDAAAGGEPALPSKPVEPTVPEKPNPPIEGALRAGVAGSVTVRGAAGAAPVEVVAEVADAEVAPVSIRVAIGSDYRLDVSSLFPDGEPQDFIVSVDDPAYLPASGKVRFRREDALAGEPVELRMDVILVPAVVATGRVVDEHGHVVSNAVVGAFLDLPGKQPPARLDAVRTDADGRYRIRVLPGRAVRLTVASGSHRPSIATLPPPTAAVAVEDLVVSEGATVSGRVVADDRPVEGVRVRMSTVTDARNYWADGLCVTEDEEGVPIRNSLSTFTDAEGRYSFRGLPERAYRMALEIDGAAAGFSLPLKREVAPPAPGVDFDISGTMLTVSVSIDGMDPAGLTIWARAESGGNGRHEVPDGGRFTVRARPGETYVLRINDKRLEPFEHRFTIPEAAREHREVISPRLR